VFDALAKSSLIPAQEEKALELLRDGGFTVFAADVKGLLDNFEDELGEEATASELMDLIKKQIVVRRARLVDARNYESTIDDMMEQRGKLEELGVDPEKITDLLRKVATLTSR